MYVQVEPSVYKNYLSTVGSYKTTDILNITVDCGDTTAILHWTAEDDLNSDFPFTLEYNCTNISSGELVRLMRYIIIIIYNYIYILYIYIPSYLHIIYLFICKLFIMLHFM